MKFTMLVAVLALSMASAQAADAQETTAPAVRAETCATPEYPRASEHAGESGTVKLALLVDVDGQVTDTRVEQSSGFAHLDTAAREGLRRCRFEPARGADGQPVAAWATLKYSFKLAQGDTANGLLFKAIARVTHLRKYVDGLPAQCRNVIPAAADALDQARKGWHARNDATLMQVEQLKQRYYATLVGTAQQSAEQLQHSVESQLRAMTDAAAAKGLATLISGPEAENRAACNMNLQSLAGGVLDIERYLPGQSRIIAAAQAAASKP